MCNNKILAEVYLLTTANTSYQLNNDVKFISCARLEYKNNKFNQIQKGIIKLEQELLLSLYVLITGNYAVTKERNNKILVVVQDQYFYFDVMYDDKIKELQNNIYYIVEDIGKTIIRNIYLPRPQKEVI